MTGDLRIVTAREQRFGPHEAGRNTYTPEQRRWAFELYATDCNRNVAAVYRRLTEDYNANDPELMPNVTLQTLKRWKVVDEWDRRFLDDFRKMHPHLYQKTVAALGMAAERAVQTLVEIMENPAALDMARVQAAKEILGRAGHMEHRRNKDDSKPDGPQIASEVSAAGLSTNELLERINQRTRERIEASASQLIDVEHAG